jgi:colanic acid biosynthesis glycosyl transferase WcaI
MGLQDSETGVQSSPLGRLAKSRHQGVREGRIPLRFLLLTQYYPPEVGAAQVRLHALACNLRERGHEVTVVTAMPNYPAGVVQPEYRGRLLFRDAVDGVPLIRTWIYAATGSSVLRRMACYLSFCISSLIGCLLAPRPDYILVESPPLFLGVTAFLVGKLRRAPFVMIVSDLWPASARDLGFVTNRHLLWLAERLERSLYRSARRVVGVTEGIRDAIADCVGRTKVMYLPNGVDVDMFRPIDGQRSGLLRPGEIGFLYAGTHGYAQALDVILDAAELLRDRPEVVFLCVGDGPEKARLRQTAEERGLANVRFADARPMSDMPVLFSEARAAVASLRDRPIFQGARPARIFPALACATPVIFSGVGEAVRLIEQNGCGLVVRPECAEELAAAVRQLAGDKTLAERLGAAGRRLVTREYNWASIVEHWLGNLYPEGVVATELTT